MNKGLLKKSVSLYSFLLNFYPESYRKQFGEEMKYVFSESLKEKYQEDGEKGVLSFWFRTILDTGRSLAIQHFESQKGGAFMKNDLIMQNKVFAFIAAGTVALLSLPYLAMKFDWVKPDQSNPADQGLNWTVADFIIMGTLLFGAGSIFVLVARIIPRQYRVFLGIAILLLFLWLWAELAVGLFTNWGS